MAKKIKLSQYDRNLISDILCNSHDWDVENLDQEIINVLTSEGTNIKKQDVVFILSMWNMIPVEKKFSPQFKIKDFLSSFVIQND